MTPAMSGFPSGYQYKQRPYLGWVGKIGNHSLDDSVPISRSGLAVKTHRRVPRAVVPSHHPAPVRREGQQQEGGHAQSSSEMRHGGIHRDDQIHTAQSISDKTHDYGWEIARMGEEIPLYAVLAERVRHPRGDELEWARKEAERLGLP